MEEKIDHNAKSVSPPVFQIAPSSAALTPILNERTGEGL
jgi:hypothetical protein